MGTVTGIAWTDHTFNPWRGCTKVSAGCANCYAEVLSHRNPSVLGIWGDDGTRPVGTESYWRQPLAWNRAAERDGVRRRVFCGSLMDVWEDRPDLIEPRARLFALIAATQHLDWQLLTKRPEGIGERLRGTLRSHDGHGIDFARAWLDGTPPQNVWLGTTVEGPAVLHRIDALRAMPAVVHFLSVEPQVASLGDVDLGGIEWVIQGGESGAKARPFRARWARDLRDRCSAANVAYFLKQMGANVRDRNDAGFDGDEPSHWPDGQWADVQHDPDRDGDTGYQGAEVRVRLHDRAGADPSEWPEDLRVQQFPHTASSDRARGRASDGG